jgi:O-antigen ligase
MVLVMAVLGGLALEAPRRAQRLGLSLLVALLALPLLFSLSRSSWLAALSAALALLLLTRRRARLLAALVLGALAIVALRPDAVTERVEYTFTEHRDSVHLGGVPLDASASARVTSWRQALRDAAEHPLLGYGITGYHFLDAQYFRILAETGILGLLVFGLLVTLLARHALRSARTVSHPLLRGLALGFLAALAGLLVHGIGANTFIIVRVAEPFWFFAGLVLVAPSLERLEETDGAGE